MKNSGDYNLLKNCEKNVIFYTENYFSVRLRKDSFFFRLEKKA